LSVVAVKVDRTTTRPRGAGTHVATLESAAMREAAERIARRLNPTRVYGLDFIIEHSTGQPWLIESNARPTPISHFRLGPSSDLIGALLAAIGDLEPVFRQTYNCAYAAAQRGGARSEDAGRHDRGGALVKPVHRGDGAYRAARRRPGRGAVRRLGKL
jgi:hypothetical protein